MHGLPYRSSFSSNDDDILHHFQGILKIDQIIKFKISLSNKMMPTTDRTDTSSTRGGGGRGRVFCLSCNAKKKFTLPLLLIEIFIEIFM
jgi:hypothetical protein